LPSRPLSIQNQDCPIPPLAPHAAFGGYKNSGVGRENHRMMLDHHSQTNCLLVSSDPDPLGFF
jgi:acyl-CoA reductase-like NAD-dependent aldehyde dehydrogenase